MRKKKLCKNTKSVLNNENVAYKLYHNFFRKKNTGKQDRIFPLNILTHETHVFGVI